MPLCWLPAAALCRQPNEGGQPAARLFIPIHSAGRLPMMGRRTCPTAATTAAGAGGVHHSGHQLVLLAAGLHLVRRGSSHAAPCMGMDP